LAGGIGKKNPVAIQKHQQKTGEKVYKILILSNK